MNQISPPIVRFLFNNLSKLYLFLLETFFNKKLPFISRTCERYVFFQLPETVIPKLDLSQVMDRKLRIQIREPRGIDGNIGLLELIVINKLVRLSNPVNLLEIGTFDGRTTLNLAANSPDNARVYTLDLPADQLDAAKLPLTRGEKRYIRKGTSGSKYRGTDCERKIIQLYGDSAAFDFSPYVDRMDFIFIDGSHSYEYVRNDSKICLNLLNKTKGVIVWHDYMKWQGVTQALNELYLNVPEFQGMRNINGTSLVCLINN